MRPALRLYPYWPTPGLASTAPISLGLEVPPKIDWRQWLGANTGKRQVKKHLMNLPCFLFLFLKVRFIAWHSPLLPWQEENIKIGAFPVPAAILLNFHHTVTGVTVPTFSSLRSLKSTRANQSKSISYVEVRHENSIISKGKVPKKTIIFM